MGRGSRGSGAGRRASAEDLPIPSYGSLSADEIVSSLPALSQAELAKVDAYEPKNQKRTAVLTRLSALRGSEPWPGYDELAATEIEAVLAEGDDQRAQDVVAYERAHQNRAALMQSALTPARFVLTSNS